jgi:hypothetical protein
MAKIRPNAPEQPPVSAAAKVTAGERVTNAHLTSEVRMALTG